MGVGTSDQPEFEWIDPQFIFVLQAFLQRPSHVVVFPGRPRRIILEPGIFIVLPKISMDFTPKAPGVGLLQCRYDPGAFHFFEDDGTTIGNTWSRLTSTPELKLEKQTKLAAFNDINGLYVDPDIFGSNGFAGIRVCRILQAR